MSAFERLAVNLSTLLVGLSGAVYAIMKYVMVPDHPYAVVSHPMQPWVLDLHVLAGPALVFAVGLIAREHILAQIGKGPGRRGSGSGLFAVVCFAPMVATGYLIQVFTDETLRWIAVVGHLATGVLYLLAFAAHMVVSMRIAARRRLAEQTAAASPAAFWERSAAARRAVTKPAARGGA